MDLNELIVSVLGEAIDAYTESAYGYVPGREERDALIGCVIEALGIERVGWLDSCDELVYEPTEKTWPHNRSRNPVIVATRPVYRLKATEPGVIRVRTPNGLTT